ncbi:MAG: DUF3015 domain-containing protein [Nitrospirota bacterium]
MKKYFLAVAGALFISPSAFAAGYGDAGCGLGSLVFGDAPGFVQVFAATTNGTSYSQAFGITSGTSNCDAKGVVLAQQQQEEFVANNYADLAKEMASGNGERLTVLAGLLGCPATGREHFNTAVQRHYGEIFSDDAASPGAVLTAVKGVVEQDATLTASCMN